MRARAAAPLVVMVVGMLALTTHPAWAEGSGTLDLTAVQGRDVQVTLTFDPPAGVTSSSPATGVVRVGDASIPAATALTVQQAPPDVAILVLDGSGSMAGTRLASAKQAASGFVGRLPADVSVGVVAFNDRVFVASPPSSDRAATDLSIQSVKADGDTALYDAVVAGLDLVPPNSKARLVLLTDGQDTASARSLGDVTSAARSRQVPVDVVAIRPTTEQLESLRQISGRTGGILLAAKTSEDLLNAFATASQSFGANALLTATIPADVNASGEQLAATVTVAGEDFSGTTTLPVLTSLAAAPTARPTEPTQASAAPSPAATVAPSPVAVPISGMAWEVLRWIPLALAVLVGASVVLVFLLVRRARQHARNARRLEQVLSYETGAQHTSASLSRTLAARRTWVGSLDAWLSRLPFHARTQAALAAGAVSLNPAGWLLVRIGVMVALTLLFWLLLGSLVWGAACGLLTGWLLTLVWLRSRSGKRRKAFAEELPDFLMLLASGLRAGLSFTHALESASSEGQGEVGLQMRRALAEVRVGADLDGALMEVAERMDNDDLRWTVMALTIQREVGGNLSTILDSAANTIKARYELRREVRTLSAEGRLSAYILVAMPLGVLAFLAIFRREYISLLWTRPAGLVMLGILILLMIAGWIWMRAVTRIKV